MMTDVGMKGPLQADHLLASEDIVVKTAYHEAGHAVLTAHLLSEWCELVTIERGSEKLEAGWGFTRRRASLNLLQLPTKELRGLLKDADVEFRRQIRTGAEREAMGSLAGVVVEVGRSGGSPGLNEELEQRYEEDDSDLSKALHVLSHFEGRTCTGSSCSRGSVPRSSRGSARDAREQAASCGPVLSA
jgi:hypothetical protein